MYKITRLALVALTLASMAMSDANDVFAQSYETPQTRLQPIGSPSRVDRYRSDPNRPVETEYRSAITQPTPAVPASYHQQASYNQGGLIDPNVRQTVLWQQEGFAFPQGQNPQGQLSTGSPVGPGFNGPPVMTTPPNSGATQVRPPVVLPTPAQAPITFAPAPRGALPLNVGAPSTLDYQPIPQPQLGNAYATVDNCSCVSPASGYSAASVGCGSPVNYGAPGIAPPSGYIAPPSQIAAPFAAPGQFSAISGNAAPLPSLFTLGQQNNPVQVGQGIIGQPVAYVPGQTIRNFIRYLFP